MLQVLYMYMSRVSLMADSKLSELTAATSVAAAATFYLVQRATHKGVTAANLFAEDAAPVTFSDTI